MNFRVHRMFVMMLDGPTENVPIPAAAVQLLSQTSVSPSSPGDSGGSPVPVAALTVACVFLLLIIIALCVLIVILKTTKRAPKTIVINPNVENPHYCNVIVTNLEEPSEQTQKRFSLKRLSWKSFKHRYSLQGSSGETVGDKKLKDTYNKSSTLPANETGKTRQKPKGLPNLPPVHNYLTLIADSKTKSGSLTDIEEELSPMPIPDISSPSSYMCVKMKTPVYSVTLEDGSYVPSNEDRFSTGSLCDHTTVRSYNKLHFFEMVDKFWIPASTTAGLYQELAAKKYREIPREQISISKEIGSGNFGSVSQGVWNHTEKPIDVAVKTLKSNCSEADRVKFLQEAAIMGQFSHHNIVRLYGVVTVGQPTMIVLELMPKGDLKTYLRRLKPSPERGEQESTQRLLLKFSREIATGMQYLSEKAFVHRDLAARNILLTEGLMCKIGDFGMARDLMDEDYYKSKGGKIPIKWTAPEALLYKKYTTASDVWSYGMVLFELWSLGKKPFAELSNSDVIQLAFSGMCLVPPAGCPRAIYLLMVDCWNPWHSQRPKFDCISRYLSQSNSALLHWSDEDKNTASLQACLLGSPLQESRKLYRDLQLLYRCHSSTPVTPTQRSSPAVTHLQ